MELKYRTGTSLDREKLQKLGLVSYGQFKELLTEENWNKFNSFLTMEDTYVELLNLSYCVVCETKEEIIGMAYLIPKGNPTNIFQPEWCYIRMVGVNPEYGGNGIGKKLIQMCIDYAKNTKEEIIALHTSEFMDTARHIYESIGFKQIQELEPIFGKKYWLYILNLKPYVLSLKLT